ALVAVRVTLVRGAGYADACRAGCFARRRGDSGNAGQGNRGGQDQGDETLRELAPPRPDVLASATWATDRHIYVGRAFEYHRVSSKTRQDRSFFHRAHDHDLTHVLPSPIVGRKRF